MNSQLSRTPLLTALSQGLSSLGNLSVTVLAARVATPTEFGFVAIVLGIHAVLLGIARAIFHEPVLIAQQSDVRMIASKGAHALLKAAVVPTLFLTGALIWGGLPFDTQALGILTVGAVTVPPVLLYDLVRSTVFKSGSAHVAVAMDGAWTGTVLVLVLGFQINTVVQILTVWGMTPLALALWGARELKLDYRGTSLRSWWLAHRSTSRPLVLDFLAGNALGQVALITLGLIGSVSTVGAIRGVFTLLGPINILQQALPLVVLPYSYQDSAIPPVSRARRSAATVWIAGSALGLLLVMLAAMVPQRIGVHVLGATWSDARSLLLIALPLALLQFGQVAMLSVFRVARRARVAVGQRILYAPAVSVLPLLAYAVHREAEVFLGATAGGMAFLCLATWRRLPGGSGVGAA